MKTAAAIGAVSAAGSIFSSSAHSKEREMLLATTKVEDFDRFLKIFSTKSLEKRKQHGCKGALVFRDPNETDRVWVIFDWDEKGWQSFASDPEVPPIMKEAGHTTKAQVAKLGAQYSS
jgi:quinol monooxygenase YgiN